MPWNTPRDWTAISGGIVTGASLNADVRDNLNVISTHTHTGAAGMGSATLSGVTLAALETMTFDDQEENPDAAGELQRNGNDLLWYNGSTVINLTQSDAEAGTGSLRTLGTTSTKAAAGNHTHTPTSQFQGGGQGGAAISDGTETDGGSIARTPSGARTLWQISGTLYVPVGSGNTYTIKLYYDASEEAVLAGRTAGQMATIFANVAAPTVSSHTVKVTVTRTAGAGSETVETVAVIHESDV